MLLVCGMPRGLPICTLGPTAAGGVALRPGFIYGSRAVGGASLPLGLVGAPLKAVSNRAVDARLCLGRKACTQEGGVSGVQGGLDAVGHPAQGPAPPQALSVLPTRSLAGIPIVGAAFVPPVRWAQSSCTPVAMRGP